MNNSFDRILTGLIATLRLEIIPQLDGEFVRGQAYGIIYMLECLRMRAAWSPDFLKPQLEALHELAEKLESIPGLPAHAPRLPKNQPDSRSPDAMGAARNEGDELVCQLIDWLGDHSATLDQSVAGPAESALRAYMHSQLRHEIKTSARPMFAEISLGRDDSKTETE